MNEVLKIRMQMQHKNAENILCCNYLLRNCGLHLEQYFQDFPSEYSEKKNTKKLCKKKKKRKKDNFKAVYKETFRNM